MGKRAKTWDVLRDDDSDLEEDVEIAQAREIHISTDGRRVLETPRSPQKRFSGHAVLTHHLDTPDPPMPMFDEDVFNLAEDETAPSTVGANLAKKRYPASVRSCSPDLVWMLTHS